METELASQDRPAAELEPLLTSDTPQDAPEDLIRVDETPLTHRSPFAAWPTTPLAKTWYLIKVLVPLAVLIAGIVLFASQTEQEMRWKPIALDSAHPFVSDLSTALAKDHTFLEVQIELPFLPRHTIKAGPPQLIVAILGQIKPDGPWLDVGGGVLGSYPDSESDWIVTYEEQPTEAEAGIGEKEQIPEVVAEFSHTFVLNQTEQFVGLLMNVTTLWPVPLAAAIEYTFRPALAEFQVLLAALILLGVYVLIVFEIVHRALAALLGAFVGLAVLSYLHTRPSLEEIITYIEFETVCLLFGMMILVGIFSATGFFEWSAVKAYKLAGGRMWRLVLILTIITAFVSAFLDNVTTMLLMAPVTIRLCSVVEVSPIPVLLAEVLFSNVGGTATPIGDPPNVIIISNPDIQAAGVTFVEFTSRMAPGVVLCMVTGLFALQRMVKREVVRRDHTVGLRSEIAVWKHSLRRQPTAANEEERQVRAMLEAHVKDLDRQLKQREGMDEPRTDIDVAALERQYVVRDRPLFIKTSLVMAAVIVLFFGNSVLPFDLSLAWIALIGAIVLMLFVGVKDVDEVLEKVEWGTLLFFASLFIMMHCLEDMQLMAYMGNATRSFIQLVPETIRLGVALTVILWSSALISAFVDNIPFTTAMIPVVLALGEDEDLDLPLRPLVWALAFGTCLGGNGTLIGASANVVTAGIAESQGHAMSFNRFFTTGFPIMVVTVLTANIYLLVLHLAIGVDR